MSLKRILRGYEVYRMFYLMYRPNKRFHLFLQVKEEDHDEL